MIFEDALQQAITTENVHDFFAAHVRRIRDTKVAIERRPNADAGTGKITVYAPDAKAPEYTRSMLDRFEIPLGQPIETFNSDIIKYGHAIDSKISDKTGLVTHVGDEPYGGIAKRQFDLGKRTITQQHLNEKMRSIRLAIEHYMPPQDFAQYLVFFRENLDFPSHQQALKQSLRIMQSDLTTKKVTAHTPDVRFWIAAKDTSKVEDIRWRVSSVKEAKQIAPHADVVLALATYHAAHRSYLSGLKFAFAEALKKGEISEEQLDTGRYVLDSASFEQFQYFGLFSEYMPMLMLQLDVQPKSKPYGEAVIDSIVKSWDDFFGTKVLTRDYGKIGVTEQSESLAGATLTCPAKAHLKATADGKLLQETFRFMENNPDVADARKLAQHTADAVQAQMQTGKKSWWGGR